MRYDEFRDRLQEALREAGLFLPHADRPTEPIDLGTTERRWRVFVFRNSPQKAEPFHVSAKISFAWSPFESARSYTCEEDLLSELLGRKERPTKTEPRILRVDIVLRASLPYGSTTPMPEPQVFGPWIAAVGEKLDESLPAETRGRGRSAVIMGYRGEVDVEAKHTVEGVPSLKGLSLSAFRMVQVPRVWNDSERGDAEKGAGKQLDQLARRFKSALDGWTGQVAELATWIRYSPPPPAASSHGGRPDDDDEDGAEPETTH